MSCPNSSSPETRSGELTCGGRSKSLAGTRTARIYIQMSACLSVCLSLKLSESQGTVGKIRLATLHQGLPLLSERLFFRTERGGKKPSQAP